MTRDEMLAELRSNVCDVIFTKKNGEERTMHCTLMESKIPKLETAETRRETTSDRIVVYDLSKEGWRSFLPETVETFAVHKDTFVEVTTCKP